MLNYYIKPDLPYRIIGIEEKMHLASVHIYMDDSRMEGSFAFFAFEGNSAIYKHQSLMRQLTWCSMLNLEQ